MSMICLHYRDPRKHKEVWVNTDKIAYIRVNRIVPDEAVIIHFSEDDRTMFDIHVAESIDEIMAMVDKPALLAERIRNVS